MSMVHLVNIFSYKSSTS